MMYQIFFNRLAIIFFAVRILDDVKIQDFRKNNGRFQSPTVRNIMNTCIEQYNLYTFLKLF